jgi:hypothetical protein
LLTACTTPAELAQQAPEQSFNTSEKLADLRDCMMLPHPETLTAIPYKEGWQVAMQGESAASIQVVLLPLSNGTHVEYRDSHMQIMDLMGMKRDVKSCLDKAPRL